ncbi:MAG TPA: hypothetical protein PKI14_01345 [Fervidobacterium sp.]|nr:hypothetical protein [Fervidobacterium sp.]
MKMNGTRRNIRVSTPSYISPYRGIDGSGIDLTICTQHRLAKMPIMTARIVWVFLATRNGRLALAA